MEEPELGDFEARLAEYTKPVGGWFGYASTFVAVVASALSIPLGLKELLNLDGPGWAKVLAWYAAALVTGCLLAIYIEQFRHRRDVARLIKQERLARLEQFQAYQQEIQRQASDHASRQDRLEERLEEYERNARVAVALPAIHGAFHSLRDTKYLLDVGAERVDWEHELEQSLRSFAQAMSSITGAPCRACIKRLEADEDSPEDLDVRDIRFFSVRTLCRDNGQRGLPTDAPSPLHRNTDFASVWDGGTGRWFFSNDLDAETGYLNEHRNGDPALFEYNAAIVWPIQKRLANDEVHLYGFLCVDAVQKHVFVSATDGELGAAYADALYAAIVGSPPTVPDGEESRTVESRQAEEAR